MKHYLNLSLIASLASIASPLVAEESESLVKPPLMVLEGLNLTEEDTQGLFALLDQIRPLVDGVIFTEEDVDIVVNFISANLQQLDLSSAKSTQDVLEKVLGSILPLFGSDQLTIEQKAALFAIMEQFISNATLTPDQA